MAQVATVGRPSLYDPKLCVDVVAYMGKGFSLTAFAGKIGVSRECIYEWARVHPEFSSAVKSAQSARCTALEEGLLDQTLAGPQITARIFALKNAAPLDWRDRYEHTGADGGPIAVTVARFTEERPTVIEGEVLSNTVAITDESK
jgi:hypothetical protein